MDTPPSSPKPYVIRHLQGTKATALGFVFRVLVSTESSGGAFTMLTVTGPITQPLTPHYHPESIETFYCLKGHGSFFAQNSARVLFQNDFHLLAPSNNHTIQFQDLDSEYSVAIQPAGIEKLYEALGASYKSSTNSPFDPNAAPLPPNHAGLALAAKYHTVFTPTFVPNTAITDGTTSDGAATWRKPGQTLPSDSSTSYYISSNDGPKYTVTSPHTNALVASLATGTQTSNNVTIGTIAFTTDTTKSGPYKHAASQSLQVVEGECTLTVAGHPAVKLQVGDLAFLPWGTSFSFASDVAYTKLYAYAAVTDCLVSALIKEGVVAKGAVPSAG